MLQSTAAEWPGNKESPNGDETKEISWVEWGDQCGWGHDI